MYNSVHRKFLFHFNPSFALSFCPEHSCARIQEREGRVHHDESERACVWLDLIFFFFGEFDGETRCKVKMVIEGIIKEYILKSDCCFYHDNETTFV